MAPSGPGRRRLIGTDERVTPAHNETSSAPPAASRAAETTAASSRRRYT